MSQNPSLSPLAAGIAVALALSSVAATVLFAPVARAEAPGGKLVAQMDALRNDKGTVFCSIWDKEEGFPTHESKAFKLAQAKPASKKATCDFGVVPAGSYAIFVVHDENDNHKLDTNFFGAPTEGYGASNDARGAVGPPKFKDAKFDYKGGGTVLKINVRY